MSKQKQYVRVERGSVTMSHLKDLTPTLYITGLSDFYETEYKVNQYNNTTYEVGRKLDRRVRESLYKFLMDSFSIDGITEPRCLSGRVMTKYGPDDFYDQIVDLEGIGPKTAILATIAITGVAPSITKNLSDQVCEAIFVSSDNTNLVAQKTNPLYYRGQDDYSTALDEGMTRNMIAKFSDIVIKASGFKPDMLPTLEELSAEVCKRVIRLDNGKCILNVQYWREQGLKELCEQSAPSGDIHDVEDILRDECDGADIVTAGLDEYQYNAVKMVVETDRKVCTITGKAGTGKSHVISALHRIYEGECALTAYQNSACDVLSRRVGGYSMCHKAIKSLMGLSMTLDANRKFAAEFSNVKLVIIDEASQIGTRHLEYVLNIVRHAHKDAKLVLVGDILQTRPVKTYGLPFVHLVKNSLCPTADLATFHRTNGLGILALCEKIRAASDGSRVVIDPDSDGVTFTQGPHTARYWNTICSSIADEYIEAGDDITKCMTISENNADCNYINWLVTSKIFDDPMPDDISLVTKHLPTIRRGMIVRSTTNKSDEDWKITNGTRYYVVDIDDLYITLKDANKEIQKIPLKWVSASEFQVAYAITVHKSQGNEAKNVRYVFRRNRDFSNAFATDKTLKYVAFSRAQEAITLHEVYSINEHETGRIELCLNDSRIYDMSI